MEERLPPFFPPTLLSFSLIFPLFIILPSSSSPRSPSFSFFLFSSFRFVSFRFFQSFLKSTGTTIFLRELVRIIETDSTSVSSTGFNDALARLMGNFSRLNESVQTRDRNFLVETSLVA